MHSIPALRELPCLCRGPGHSPQQPEAQLEPQSRRVAALCRARWFPSTIGIKATLASPANPRPHSGCPRPRLPSPSHKGPAAPPPVPALPIHGVLALAAPLPGKLLPRMFTWLVPTSFRFPKATCDHQTKNYRPVPLLLI